MVAASAVGIFAVCHASPAQCVSKLCMPSLLLYNKKSPVSNQNYVVFSRISCRPGCMIVFHIYLLIYLSLWNGMYAFVWTT